MTDNRTTELPRMQLHRLLEKHDVDYWCVQQTTFWNSESGSEFLAYQYQVNGVYKLAFKGVNIAPEQAIAATLGSGECEQEVYKVEERESAWGGVTRHCGNCGADLDCDTRNTQNFCPRCGKAVER